MFKKTCYECGAKVDTLFEGLCSKCISEDSPPIQEITPLNLKYCNSCKKININNQLITREELERRLPDIIKRNIKINKNYTLENLEIKNFGIEGAKISFDVGVNCKLKE
ncbi:MAG: NMD3-related protein [Candidatus Woesearchaeota archaeon]|nr:NMD3-related protein [Candidatus Woesearchaeota archaeon]